MSPARHPEMHGWIREQVRLERWHGKTLAAILWLLAELEQARRERDAAAADLLALRGT